MLFRVLRVGFLTIAAIVGIGTMQTAQAQYSCGQSYGSGFGGYGSGYGNGYGYGFQGPSFYGQQGMYSQSNYSPQPAYGFATGYAAPSPTINQSFYPSSSGYNSNHHHHSHPWHPGHYLMGHY